MSFLISETFVDGLTLKYADLSLKLSKKMVMLASVDAVLDWSPEDSAVESPVETVEPLPVLLVELSVEESSESVLPCRSVV